MSVCLLNEWLELKPLQISSFFRYSFFLSLLPKGLLSSTETICSVCAVSSMVLHSTGWSGLYGTSKLCVIVNHGLLDECISVFMLM